MIIFPTSGVFQNILQNESGAKTCCKHRYGDNDTHHIQRSCDFGRAFAKQIEQVNTGHKAANCDVTSQCLGNLDKQE